MKILLLGDRGLLGNDLKLLAKLNKDFDITVLRNDIKKWPHREFKKAVLDVDCDILINAISSTDYDNNDIIRSVHHKLPLWLIKNKKCKIVLFSSDIVNQLESGAVDDKFKNYAIAKQLMERDVKSENNALCIRSSFLGLTKTPSNLIYRLFELNPNKVINVDNNSFWSGMTTLEFYEFIVSTLLTEWISGLRIIGCEKKSIYDLFNTINELFSYNKKITILNGNVSKDRSCNSDIILSPIDEQLLKLKNVAKSLKNSNIIQSGKNS